MAKKDQDWLARLTSPSWNGVSLVLRGRYQWELQANSDGADGDDFAEMSRDLLLARAQMASSGYRYSPSHGRPGVVLATQVAEQLGNGTKVELPPEPAYPPDAVF